PCQLGERGDTCRGSSARHRPGPEHRAGPWPRERRPRTPGFFVAAWRDSTMGMGRVRGSHDQGIDPLGVIPVCWLRKKQVEADLFHCPFAWRTTMAEMCHEIDIN